MDDSRLPSREEIIKAIQADLEKQGLDPSTPVSFDMTEEMLVFGLTGSFLTSLEIVDEPLFIEGANGTLGTHVNGEPLPPEDLVQNKVPLTLSGYGLLDGRGNLIGFTCFGSQLPK